MNKRLTADDLPCATVFALLPDADLESVDSSVDESIYWYHCGCRALRFNDSSDCRVKWCKKHTPRGRRLHIV